MMKINLGCGGDIINNYINVDLRPGKGVDVITDLEGKLPFKFNSVDEIFCSHVIEHIDNYKQLLEEIYYVLKKDGLFLMKVPHVSYGFIHPDHKRGISVGFFGWFTKNSPERYGNMDWNVLSVKFKYFRLQKFPYNFINFFINPLLNIYPGFTERFLCYIIGGIEEIIFKVRKK